MPLRLSELLERIRPAGTPGAASEGERKREELDRIHETADLAAILEGFEQEAAAIIAAANTRADRLCQDADRQARQIRVGVPDRIATAQAAATRAHDETDEAERRAVESETAAEIARLTTRAATLIPSLRDAAMNAVWSSVASERRSKDVP